MTLRHDYGRARGLSGFPITLYPVNALARHSFLIRSLTWCRRRIKGVYRSGGLPADLFPNTRAGLFLSTLVTLAGEVNVPLPHSSPALILSNIPIEPASFTYSGT